MNSKQKNSLEYSKPQLEQFEDNTILEVLPQKTDEADSSKYILIKHDYYSSDSDHGRKMLKDFLSVLCEASYENIIIYLADKGTMLLDEACPLYEDMLALINRSELIIADKDSIDLYKVNLKDNPKITIRSMLSISEELIYLPGILVLE